MSLLPLIGSRNCPHALAELEQELIHERTHAGLTSARARGRVGGRRRGLSEEAERTAIVAETLYRRQKLGVNEIAQRLRIFKITLCKYLRYRGGASSTVIGKPP